MLHLSVLLAILAASSVNAVPIPLNINLGAFSPALVVGDGEISFGGAADVTKLMTALSGASQEASSNNAASIEKAAVAVPDGPSIVTPEATTSTSALESVVPSATEAAPVPVVGVNGIGRDVIEPRTADTVEVGKRDVETREVEIKIKARTSDQEKRDLEAEKRDLAGFNAALAFATGALKTGPEVQLGTGEGGSGVGIIVKPANGNAPAAPKGEKKEKREERRSLPTVTMLKLRTIGGDQSTASKVRRDLQSEKAEADGVNLNVGGDGQAYELTIAEIKPSM